MSFPVRQRINEELERHCIEFWFNKFMCKIFTTVFSSQLESLPFQKETGPLRLHEE